MLEWITLISSVGTALSIYFILQLRYEKNLILFLLLSIGSSLIVGLYSTILVFGMDDYGSNIGNIWLIAIFIVVLAFLILYPLFELIRFSEHGVQSQERYHRKIEQILDYCTSRFSKTRDFTRVTTKYVVGFTAYIIAYFLLAFVLYLFFSYSLVWSIMISMLFIPTLILGYYGALGTYRALEDKSSNFIKRWITRMFGLLAIFGAIPGLIFLLTGVDFVFELQLYFIKLRLDPRPADFLSNLFPITFFAYLSLKGFYTDFWRTKQETNLFHYIYGVYLLVIIAIFSLFKLLVNLNESAIYFGTLIPEMYISDVERYGLDVLLILKQLVLVFIVPFAFFLPSFRVEILSQDLESQNMKVAMNAFKKLEKMENFNSSNAIVETLGYQSIFLINKKTGQSIKHYDFIDEVVIEPEIVTEFFDQVIRFADEFRLGDFKGIIMKDYELNIYQTKEIMFFNYVSRKRKIHEIYVNEIYNSLDRFERRKGKFNINFNQDFSKVIRFPEHLTKIELLARTKYNIFVEDPITLTEMIPNTKIYFLLINSSHMGKNLFRANFDIGVGLTSRDLMSLLRPIDQFLEDSLFINNVNSLTVIFEYFEIFSVRSPHGINFSLIVDRNASYMLENMLEIIFKFYMVFITKIKEEYGKKEDFYRLSAMIISDVFGIDVEDQFDFIPTEDEFFKIEGLNTSLTQAFYEIIRLGYQNRFTSAMRLFNKLQKTNYDDLKLDMYWLWLIRSSDVPMYINNVEKLIIEKYGLDKKLVEDELRKLL